MTTFSHRRIVVFLLSACLVLPPLCAFAASPADSPASAVEEVKTFRAHEARRLFAGIEAAHRAEAAGVQPSQPFDIQHYDLALKSDPAARTISGTVTMTFEPKAAVPQLKMRLHPKLKATGATLDGVPIAIKRDGANMTFKSNPPLQPGQAHVLAVTYGGTPVVTGGLGGGMMFDLHGSVSSATTLSEPFDSYAWWPCVDDVTDKATMEMHLTVPAGMTGASNGSLTDTVTNSDGSITYTWHEDYPLSNYLISANVTNYAKFLDHYTSLDGKTVMPIEYYVYPEGLSNSMATVARVPDMITYFAGIAGEYPFLQEKYGMVAFPWGGGMEHQTLTSMGDAYLGARVADFDGIYAHELAHMWWGDEVTCATWNDIWLNEGFATYYEILWLTHHFGIEEGEFMAQYYDDGIPSGYLSGSVYRKNGDKPFADTGAVYDKGAWVLHMLKHVMGESAFNQALRDYRSARHLGNASTADLRTACEAVYGQPLTWFFDQWVYTPKRPIYRFSYKAGAGSVTVALEQTQSQKIANRSTDGEVYIMPVDFTLHFQDGTAETRTAVNDKRSQTFTFPVGKPVASVAFDEGNWILKTIR